MRKILFYNWIPFDEKEGKGGGVTIYTRNLIRHFIEDPNWDVYFLSSGRAYDLVSKTPRIRKTKNVFDVKCKSFEIVNSPVFSSARISFSFPEKIINDRSLLELMIRFFKEQDGFDVVHFQNLEGLSASVLDLKEHFPDTAFVYSLHNYYPFCPQVMLWREDRENCRIDHCGSDCLACMPKDVYAFKVRLNQYVSGAASHDDHGAKINALRQLQKVAAKYADMRTKRRHFSDEQKKQYGEKFRLVEKLYVDGINRNMDAVLAVSERVADIAVAKGIDPDKVIVNYIGTEVAKDAADKQRRPYDGSVLNICYLGYMRTMKGFYFLLDALENMQKEMASRIGVVIASPGTDKKAIERIEKLKDHFSSVKYYDGYTHEGLDDILSDVHLGIVPPLWEDNLPQVAIEMKAKGVAVLASDRGGAHELSGAKEFVFNAGDINDFHNKLKRIMDEPQVFGEYWMKQMRLITMQEHISQLEEIYNKDEE